MISVSKALNRVEKSLIVWSVTVHINSYVIFCVIFVLLSDSK